MNEYSNNNGYNNGEYRGSGYNDDLDMDARQNGFTGYGYHSEPRYIEVEKKKTFGQKLLSAVLVGGLMLGSSAATLAGYIHFTEQGSKPQVIQGGQQVVYTLSSEEGSLTPQEIFVKCNPSVVAISTQSRSYYGIGESSGTGIIMSEDGYIITNHHVIDNAVDIQVTTKNGVYPATVVGSKAISTSRIMPAVERPLCI